MVLIASDFPMFIWKGPFGGKKGKTDLSSKQNKQTKKCQNWMNIIIEIYHWGSETSDCALNMHAHVKQASHTWL